MIVERRVHTDGTVDVVLINGDIVREDDVQGLSEADSALSDEEE